MTTALQTSERVVEALAAHRHHGSRETQVQDSVEHHLRAAGFAYEREAVLSERDRPDFLVAGTVVVEVKMKASRSAVLSQLGRYAQHERVRALVLASPLIAVVAGLPEAIHGKPVLGVALRGGWL